VIENHAVAFGSQKLVCVKPWLSYFQNGLSSFEHQAAPVTEVLCTP